MVLAMSAQKDAAVLAAGSSIPVRDLAIRFRDDLLPQNQQVSYMFLAAQPTDEERKEFLEEPVAALPPRVAALLPHLDLLFVPFLERGSARRNGHASGGSPDLVSLVRPSRPVTHARVTLPGAEVLLFAFEDRDVGEHHYRFFQSVATLVAERLPEDFLKSYLSMVRGELRANVHGEVDDASWEKKIALLERQSLFHGTNKALREYVNQSFIDTMTLYLHGICCDLDVETGPRQLASRHLRKRLEMLETAFPPPTGYAVFPEDLKN
jgi:hypothetical protein